MSESRLTKRFAVAVTAVGLFAAYPALAQSEQQTTTIYPVSFSTGSIQLHPADHETIHGVAAMMERDPNLLATVYGKADTVGTEDFNDHLSWRRAATVFEALVFEYKVPANRVDMRWSGDRLPVVKTDDQTAELQNRVVEILVR